MASGALTFAELQQVWVNAGGSNAPDPAVPGYTTDQVAAAIALAESSGNPDANPYDPTNPPSFAGGMSNPLNYSYGLWQINGGNFAALEADGIATGAALFNPSTNAAAAIAIQSGAPGFGGGWNNWSTFSGAYRSFLPSPGTSGATPTPGSGIAYSPAPQEQAMANTSDPLGLDALETIVAAQIKTLALNTAVVFAGIVLLILGVVWIIASNDDLRKTAVTTVKAAALA